MALSSEGKDVVGRPIIEEGVTESSQVPSPYSPGDKMTPWLWVQRLHQTGKHFSTVPSGLSEPEHEWAIGSPPRHASQAPHKAIFKEIIYTLMLHKSAFKDQNLTFGNVPSIHLSFGEKLVKKEKGKFMFFL